MSSQVKLKLSWGLGDERTKFTLGFTVFKRVLIVDFKRFKHCVLIVTTAINTIFVIDIVFVEYFNVIFVIWEFVIIFQVVFIIIIIIRVISVCLSALIEKVFIVFIIVIVIVDSAIFNWIITINYVIVFLVVLNFLRVCSINILIIIAVFLLKEKFFFSFLIETVLKTRPLK